MTHLVKSLPFGRLATALVTFATACSYDATYPSPTPPPPTHAAGDVDVVFCSAAAPKWVAVQDGNGKWTRVEPRTSGTLASFSLSLASDHGAIAVAREFASGLTTLTV